MTGAGADWEPSASRAALAARAAALTRVRAFFAARAVLEVDTPMVVNAAVTDLHIHSAAVRLGEGRDYFLHTSPEYAMKRLLASGTGDIYQVCHVVRGYERGPLHNAEFTLIEWYRTGFGLGQLMDEVDALVRELLGRQARARASERISYRDAWLKETGMDPFAVPLEQLAREAERLGFQRSVAAASRDELLELLMGTQIGPRLGRGALTFVHSYPASQAALARLDPADPGCALRFELYAEGVELANGFHELCSAEEQRQRFENDRRRRQQAGIAAPAMDHRLLQALEHGLPECAGVALGFDRVLMLARGASRIDEVLPFPIERA